MRLAGLLVILASAAGIWLYTHPEHSAGLRELLPGSGTSLKTDRLFKWRNGQGEWQVTDTPPPAGTTYEILDFREDVNVLPVPPRLGGES